MVAGFIFKGAGGEVGYDARILGGGDFVAAILREAEPRVKRYLPERDREVLIERIIKEKCKKGEVGEGEMRWGGQRRRFSGVRAKISWVLSREYGVPIAEIARQLGVCTSASPKQLEKLRGRLKGAKFPLRPLIPYVPANRLRGASPHLSRSFVAHFDLRLCILLVDGIKDCQQ